MGGGVSLSGSGVWGNWACGGGKRAGNESKRLRLKIETDGRN